MVFNGLWTPRCCLGYQVPNIPKNSTQKFWEVIHQTLCLPVILLMVEKSGRKSVDIKNLSHHLHWVLYMHIRWLFRISEPSTVPPEFWCLIGSYRYDFGVQIPNLRCLTFSNSKLTVFVNLEVKTALWLCKVWVRLEEILHQLRCMMKPCINNEIKLPYSTGSPVFGCHQQVLLLKFGSFPSFLDYTNSTIISQQPPPTISCWGWGEKPSQESEVPGPKPPINHYMKIHSKWNMWRKNKKK